MTNQQPEESQNHSRSAGNDSPLAGLQGPTGSISADTRPETAPCPKVDFSKSARATKIVATFGPGPDPRNADQTREDRLRELIESGANVIRLNFSHGTQEDHGKSISCIRKLSEELKTPVAILADLKGPKTRIGEIPGGSRQVDRDEILQLSYGKGNKRLPWTGMIQTEAFDPVQELSVDEQIFLADASVKLRAIAIEENQVLAVVEQGGQLRSKVGIAIPDTELKGPVLSQKDIADLRYALEHGVDYIAQSFVGKAADVLELRAHMKQIGIEVPIIAKIERRKAIQNLADICKVADGLMVARGDLGVDIPEEQVPAEQERIIRMALLEGIPVITATEMLQSMVSNSRPTRAEVADVAGAVRDGSWGVMLSQETAIGSHPGASVRKMASIARENESRFDSAEYRTQLLRRATEVSDRTESLVAAACSQFLLNNADAIIVASGSGNTCRLVAKYMPDIPVFGVSTSQEGLNRMALYRGVTPIVIALRNSQESELERISKILAGAFFKQNSEAKSFRPIIIYGPSQNGTSVPPGISFPQIFRQDIANEPCANS